jgi:hypothetical protein
MRFLLGIIVGVGLTIGGAYISDGGKTMDAPSEASAARPMVNWDVVGTNWQYVSSRLRREWDRLAAK